MKAAIQTVEDGVITLRCATIPDPQPAAGEILIRIKAISVEGGDTAAG